MAEQKINAGFVRDGASKISEEDLRKVSDKAEEIKAKAKGPLGKYVGDVKVLLSMINDYINGRYREVPWSSITAVAFALLYIFSPIDFIPDYIPVIGLADDALVLAICLVLIEEDLVKYQEWKVANA
ncbi:MAG: YkvA family protein [Desulfuromonadaceae bacterium]|nr:YkvA family protein [Desulfuromonadaceae bacterium]MDD2848158.1 YkvA family protein [Desulfuromonadaceae bacterium]MDD4132001.1 YkvA family protein [Desulfuromonadaceae bacterium]